MTSNVLLNIPHASTLIPTFWKGVFLLEDEELRLEIVKMTDWHTDVLFDLGDSTERLVFPVSRLLIDPERFEDDAIEPMATRGMGAVYTLTHEGKPLKKDEAREELLREFYRPYHTAMENWVERSLLLEGRALIIDCHSFPSIPLPCDLDQSPKRPDFCIGTDPFHTPSDLVALLVDCLRTQSYSVGVDKPYSGSIVPMKHYRQTKTVSSVMVEVNRRLYLDESTGEPSGCFEPTRKAVTNLLGTCLSWWGSSR